MSHMIYPNLAKLENFDCDLNYTGIILDGWNDPVNLVPLVLLALCLWCGAPGMGFQAWWVLINTAIIHPMDFFVGALGRGPKYLTDEYAVMDIRYWPTDDPWLTWIAYMELAAYVPLCYFWYKAIVQDRWYRHFCALIVSTMQSFGAVLYLCAEWYDGFIHLPTYGWPDPKFDTYVKVKYFWLIFWGCNLVWVVVPAYIMHYSFVEMKKQLDRDQKKKLR